MDIFYNQMKDKTVFEVQQALNIDMKSQVSSCNRRQRMDYHNSASTMDYNKWNAQVCGTSVQPIDQLEVQMKLDYSWSEKGEFYELSIGACGVITWTNIV